MDTKKIKILYAEDNRITAQETGEALEDNGYEVKTVFDGDEAWLAYSLPVRMLSYSTIKCREKQE